MLQRIKAAYVSTYLTVSWLLLALASWKLWQGADVLAWSGVALSAAPMAVLIAIIMIRPVLARTSENLLEIHIPVGIGSLLALIAGSLSGDAMAMLAGAVSYAGFVGYTFWYSRYERSASDALRVGNTLPDVSLTTSSGTPFSLRDVAGQPSVILFFRGNWCPLCMAQIKEIAAEYREIQALGAKVYLVSPQPQGHSAALAKRFDVDFEFLVDRDNTAAKALGIVSAFGIPTGLEVMGYDTEAPMPTVIITDANGRVHWADETDNYRVRPEPETFLKVLKTL